MVILGLISGASTYAQVATDGTVGPRIQLDGPEFDISADLGRQAGAQPVPQLRPFLAGNRRACHLFGP
jgi:hypothetical protein